MVAGDTKVVERGHADRMYVDHHRHRPGRPAGAAVAGGAAARRPGARLGPGRHARDGDHARPRRVRARRGAAVGHAPAVADGRRDAGGGGPRAALPARRHPGWRRVGPERARPRVGRGDARAGGGRAGGAGRPGRGRDPRHRPHVRGQRGGPGGRGRTGGGRRGPGRHARRTRRGARQRRSARCGRNRRGWCSCRRRSGAGGSWTSSSATRCRGSVEGRSRDGDASSSCRASTRRRPSPPM